MRNRILTSQTLQSSRFNPSLLSRRGRRALGGMLFRRCLCGGCLCGLRLFFARPIPREAGLRLDCLRIRQDWNSDILSRTSDSDLDNRMLQHHVDACVFRIGQNGDMPKGDNKWSDCCADSVPELCGRYWLLIFGWVAILLVQPNLMAEAWL